MCLEVRQATRGDDGLLDRTRTNWNCGWQEAGGDGVKLIVAKVGVGCLMDQLDHDLTDLHHTHVSIGIRTRSDVMAVDLLSGSVRYLRAGPAPVGFVISDHQTRPVPSTVPAKDVNGDGKKMCR